MSDTGFRQVDEEDEWDGPWIACQMECAICNKEWVAVYPACALKLECPKCGYSNDVTYDVSNE